MRALHLRMHDGDCAPNLMTKAQGALPHAKRPPSYVLCPSAGHCPTGRKRTDFLGRATRPGGAETTRETHGCNARAYRNTCGVSKRTAVHPQDACRSKHGTHDTQARWDSVGKGKGHVIRRRVERLVSTAMIAKGLRHCAEPCAANSGRRSRCPRGAFFRGAARTSSRAR